MIANIKFKLEPGVKISKLTTKNISFYCDCKALKVDAESADADVTVDLCNIHEEMMRKLDAGLISQDQAVIPKVRIEF